MFTSMMTFSKKISKSKFSKYEVLVWNFQVFYEPFESFYEHFKFKMDISGPKLHPWKVYYGCILDSLRPI